MGFPAVLEDGTSVEIVSQGHTAEGVELYHGADGTVYTRRLQSEGGNDAHRLYVYDAETADDLVPEAPPAEVQLTDDELIAQAKADTAEAEAADAAAAAEQTAYDETVSVDGAAGNDGDQPESEVPAEQE